jgi:ketosteroid isomerase-like protein
MRGMRVLLIACLVGCGSGSKPPAPPTPPTAHAELSPALAPLAWWLGDWRATGENGTEHWVASSGVIFGIALHDGGNFEVMVLDDGDGPGTADGTLRFFAMPGGVKSVEFQKRDLQATAITFANDAHDYPKTIAYARDGETLTATLGGGDKSDHYRFERTTAARAPELEAADVAFAKDTAARGVDGWVAAFEPKGGMMTKQGRVEGADAIRELMAPLLATTKVEWAPVASARRGDVGYTVGKATFTGKDSWRSTYVTIWKKQPDGAWRVAFDTGRTVQAR